MIIDAHHHLWEFNSADFGWMDDSMDLLKKDYLPGDLEAEIVDVGVTGTVVVQARQMIEETTWLLEQAEIHPFIKGVVGWLDLCSDELKTQLDQFAVHPKLVGLRHVIHDEPDDSFMLRSAFLSGIEMLQTYDLTYDLLLFTKHLMHAKELVRKFPEQRFVLDHMAKPFIKLGEIQPWKDHIESLAAHSNVWCKISGMATEADLAGWRYEDFIPYMEVVFEAFGSKRIMLGSDWPVCKLAGEYKEILNIPLTFIASLSNSERVHIISRNAIECYQLEN